MEINLSYQLEIIVLQVEGLKSITGKKIIFCTIEVGGEEKLQTEHVEASNPMFNTQGDYTLSHPLPIVKLKLYVENAGVLALDDIELGRVVLKLTPFAFTSQNAEWHKMKTPKNSIDKDLKLKLICRFESPPNLKHCGYLYAVGKISWKKWKQRYYVLYEVSENMCALGSYKEKKSVGTEMILLDGYTVDYIEREKARLMVGMNLKGGQFFFSAVKEGDNLLLACEDEKECRAWVAALYKATGQSNKPVFPHSNAGGNANTSKTSNTQPIQSAKGTPKPIKH